jgi:hypothetical protein
LLLHSSLGHRVDLDGEIMRLVYKNMEICTYMIGRPTFIVGVGKWEAAFHWFPKSERIWGYQEDWCDGPIHVVGLGPLLQIIVDDQHSGGQR